MSRCRLALAGLATAVLFTCRLMDVVFAAAIVGWLAWTRSARTALVLAGADLGRTGLARLQPLVFRHDPGRASPARAISQRFSTACPAPGRANLARRCARDPFQPESRTAGFQPLDRRGDRDAGRADRETAPRRPLAALRAARVPRSLSAHSFQVLRLVGRTLLWSAVLDRRRSPVRHPLCVRTRLDVDAVARLDGDLGHDHRLFDRRPGDRSVLLSQHLERPAAHRRPPPRAPVGLARHGAIALPDRIARAPAR